jgi:glycerate-2-kinase
MGFDAGILSSEVTGEARDAGRWLGGKARGAVERSQQCGGALCLISGGETTVVVNGEGKGGRNTELALAAAAEIEGLEGVSILSCGTDGTDGPTDAAGAFCDGTTIARAGKLGISADVHLCNNDSYTFFDRLGDLIVTGPTGTNVMDIQITLILP